MRGALSRTARPDVCGTGRGAATWGVEMRGAEMCGAGAARTAGAGAARTAGAVCAAGGAGGAAGAPPPDLCGCAIADGTAVSRAKLNAAMRMLDTMVTPCAARSGSTQGGPDWFLHVPPITDNVMAPT
jgi:hypothetical protein